MIRSSDENCQQQEDIQALRGLIADLAARCDLDLSDRTAVRQFIDAESSSSQSERIDPLLCKELRAMLILLYRLEASSCEDLGVEGMHRLWRQHREFLARFRAG